VPPVLTALALLEQALAAAVEAELVLPSYRILQTSG
jgi:hypothetical protein